MKYSRSDNGDIYVDYEPGMEAQVDWWGWVKKYWYWYVAIAACLLLIVWWG